MNLLDNLISHANNYKSVFFNYYFLIFNYCFIKGSNCYVRVGVSDVNYIYDLWLVFTMLVCLQSSFDQEDDHCLSYSTKDVCLTDPECVFCVFKPDNESETLSQETCVHRTRSDVRKHYNHL